MPIAAHQNSAIQDDLQWSVAELYAIRGMNTRDNELSLVPEEFTNITNFWIRGRKIIKRAGSSALGTSPASQKALILGHLEQDSGQTLLMLLGNGTLYKYSGGTWTASDKTDYSSTAEGTIVTFTDKSGSSVVSGTSTSGSTKYLIEDTTKTWTANQYAGFCVTIEGETKYISSNTATVLFLSDRLDNDTDSAYQTKSYTIHAIAPFAIIANGSANLQKYDLTTHTGITGISANPFKFLAVHQGRLWGAADEGNNNDRVNIGDTGLAGTFTKDTNLNINLQFYNDGDALKGIMSLPLNQGSVLIAPKKYSTHIVEGDNVLNYRTRPIFSKSGCASHKTLQVAGKTAVMVNMNHEVIRFTGEDGVAGLEKPVPISDPIQETLDAETDANIQAASAGIWDNKYILSVGDNCYYYDLLESIRIEQHVWGKIDFPFSINCFHSIGDILYAGDRDTGAVYQLFTGNQDTGSVNITGTLETAATTFPGGMVGWVERVEMQISEQASTIMRLQYKLDGEDNYGEVIPRTLDQERRMYSFPIKERCRSIKFRFTENGSNAAIHIALPIRVVYSVESIHDDTTKADLTTY